MSTKKARFGIADILAILLLIVVVGLIVVFVLWQNGTINANMQNQYESLDYTIKMTGVDAVYTNTFVVGATVYNSSDTSLILGTITGVSLIESQTFTTDINESGNLPVYTLNDTYDVFVTIHTDKAEKNANGFYDVGGTRILVGSPVYYSSGLYNRVAFCTSFTPITTASEGGAE